MGIHRHRLVVLVLGAVAATTVTVPVVVADGAGANGVPFGQRTSVSRLTATPRTLPDTGGTVNLSATVANASTCSITYTSKYGAALTGLPVTMPCGTGPVAVSVGVPGNHCCFTHRYLVTLLVSGTREVNAVVMVVVPPAYVPVRHH